MSVEPERGWKYDLTTIAAFILTVGYGLRNIPPAIEGIPFIQVLPALFLAGVVVAILDTAHLLLYRRTTDGGLPSLELIMFFTAVGIIKAVVQIKLHNLRHRIGLVDEDAATHYDRLSDRE